MSNPVGLALLFSLLPAVSPAANWVPIMLDDLVFFVPAGSGAAPPTPSPLPPAVTGGLLNCVEDTQSQHPDWSYPEDFTELYCAGYNITDLSGISEMSNLERLAIGHNYVGDVTPLLSLSRLKWLHMASPDSTNSIFTTDIDRLKNLPLLEEIFVNNDISDPARMPVNHGAVFDGFLGINAFDDGFPALKAITIQSFNELSPPTGRPVACETINALYLRWESEIADGTFALNGMPSLPCTATQPNESY